MKVLSLIAFLCIAGFGFSQTAISLSPGSNGQTFNTCNGFIIDSGGQGGPGYGNSENTTITLCPGTPGEIISVVFNLFQLSTVDDNPLPAVTNVDYMDIYDGPSTASPTLGTYEGNQLQGVVINATALNTSGCITIRFRSNTTGTGMFTAQVTCETPCATPTAAGIIVGGATSDSIRVCVGEVVDFSDNGSYAAMGFTLTDYDWDFMDGNTGSGQTVSHSFDTPGQYRVQLFVTDDNGCDNTNLIDLEVFVATIPSFEGFPGDTTLCLGESITFGADPESYEVLWDGFDGSLTIDDGCLPDTLLGVSQNVEILQTGFAGGATITDVSQIQSLCLDLEHSFMGDIVIIVECPNGQNEILHQQGGGGTQIGIPNQLDNVDCSDPTTQGTPFTYCFTPTATETWVEWVTNSGFGGTIPAGDYEPIEPMTNLVGCPLNGVWTLTVIDNWAADDGTLFAFDINLDPSLYPPVTVFEPQIGHGSDSSWWDSPAPYVTYLSADGDTISITPTAAGTYTYTYHVMDDFGCEHDSSVTITVVDNLIPNAGPDVVVCDNDPVQLNGSINGMASPCDYILDLQDMFWDGWGMNSLTITINGVPTTYSVPQNTGQQIIPIAIPNGASVVVDFYDNNDFTSFDIAYTLTGPTGDVVVVGGGNFTPPDPNPVTITADCFNGYVFEWTTAIGTFNNPNIAGPIGSFNTPGPVTLTVYPAGHPLCATSDQLDVSISASAYPGHDSTLTVCSQGASVDLFPLIGPGASVNGSWFAPNGTPVTMPYNPPSMTPGAYDYAVDSNGCISHAYVVVTEIVTSVNPIVTNVSCFGANDGSVVATTQNANTYSLNGGPSIPITGNAFTLTNLSPGSYTLDVTGINGCSGSQVFTITEPPQLQITSISPDITICPGATTTLTATATGGATPSSYTFTWVANNAVAGQGASFTPTVNTTTQYCVILTEACGSMPDTACVVVSNPAPIIPSFTPDVTSGCFPVPVVFTNTSTGGNVTSMFVDYGDGQTEVLAGMAGSDHLYALPGVYTVSLVVTSDIGCVYSATFPNLISVFNKPNAYFDILPNPVSMFNPYVQLINNSSPDVVSYVWDIEEGTPAMSTDENVYASFPDGVAANYEVTLDVTNADGCTATVTRIVQVVSEVLLYAPNAFTPDGDEFNQTWFVYIDGIDVSRFELRIYNRWGETVWESHDPNGQWDGTYKGQIVPAGIYNWTIQVKDAMNDGSHTFEGSMSVIR